MAEPFVNLAAAAVSRADDRGSLEVLYESATCVLKRSFSRQGVFRGLHLQRAPHQQTKLIRVVSGRILDCVVDPDDPALALHTKQLGPEDGWTLIAPHLAHGFYALEDCWFEYVCDGSYQETSESAYSIVDFLVGELGLPPPIQSAKDARAPKLNVTAPAKR